LPCALMTVMSRLLQLRSLPFSQSTVPRVLPICEREIHVFPIGCKGSQYPQPSGHPSGPPKGIGLPPGVPTGDARNHCSA
jgi:hypothetical protein